MSRPEKLIIAQPRQYNHCIISNFSLVIILTQLNLTAIFLTMIIIVHNINDRSGRNS
jgi:hypothetical protein